MFSRFLVSQVKHNSYFLIGVVLGLWLALALVPLEETPVACPTSEAPASDDYEPHREARPLGAAGPGAGRSVQRPRYYTTELGIRGSLMSGVLSSEDALSTRTAALNATASRLQPLKVFVAAATGAAPPRPNVVGFTDTREMLKPFHALKYLADNCLDEYDFFFLVSDTTFVNARRLRDLVSKLSVSQDVYMGTVAEDDSHYCTLEGGILLSNSVVRAVHGELDWCVRNSYSAHHHENIGRCVLHAAHQRCRSTLQGETYSSVRLREGEAPAPSELLGAVTAAPLTDPAHFYRLHAHVSRLFLEQDAKEAARLRMQLAMGRTRHPRGFRNCSWPAGLRADPGLAPPTPSNRFDHLRWTLFNESHAFLGDDHHAVAPHSGATSAALQLVLGEVVAWAQRRWGAAEVRLWEGALRWEPAHALRYRLLLMLQRDDGRQTVRQVEVARALGAARLVPMPYVTESAHLTMVVPVRVQDLVSVKARSTALRRDANTTPLLESELIRRPAMLQVVIREPGVNETAVAALKAELVSLVRHPADVLEAQLQQEELHPGGEEVQRVALKAALARAPRDALILMLPPHADFNQDFLNRARMNSIQGSQWFWALGFGRYAHTAHPSFRTGPARPQHHTGLFAPAVTDALAFYRSDYESALSSSASLGLGVAQVLSGAPLRCIRAPDPALVLAPPPPPCPPKGLACLRAHREDQFAHLRLGDKHALAKLLLEERANYQQSR